MLNVEQIASVGVRATVREYYFLWRTPGRLPAAGLDEVKAAQGDLQRAVLFFDTGGRPAWRDAERRPQNSELYGRSFERGSAGDARLPRLPPAMTASLRRSSTSTRSNFVVGDHTAIEVKATRKVAAATARPTARDEEGGAGGSCSLRDRGEGTTGRSVLPFGALSIAVVRQVRR